MKQTRIMHKMWKEMARLPKKVREDIEQKIPPMLGKWYYYYENKNGRIGLARINDYPFWFGKKDKMRTPHHYEACGHLDYETFKTKKDAEIAIYKALKEKYPEKIPKNKLLIGIK